MVVLVDTSVWIDYIRKTDDRLTNLLASVSLTPGALVWTRDKRLQRVAERLSLATDFQD